MENVYLQEAFRALDILNEEDFNLSSTEDIKDLGDAIEDDENEMNSLLDVIDPETDEVEEIKDNYTGNVILDCKVCHSKLYKDPSEVVIDEEKGIANIDEECPCCYSTEGYEIIGQVAPYEDMISDDDEVDVKESLRRSRNLREGKVKPGTGFMHKLVRSDIEKILDGYDDQIMALNDYKVIVNNSVSRKIKELNDSKSEVIADRKDESLKEHFEKVEIETDKEKMQMTSDENGKTVVVTEPKDDNEVLAPVSDETVDEIDMNSEEAAEDTFPEEDVDIDEFSEEEFDELGESYLKKVYENVDSFKTSSVRLANNQLIVEGIIGFNSGKKKQTTFVFEGKEKTKKGNMKFIGENLQLSRGKKSFTLNGKMDGKKFISESFNYNYRAKDAKGNSTRLYGTVRVK